MPAGISRTIVGPVKITATATGTNIPSTGGEAINTPAAGTYWLVKHIRFTNTDTSARTVTLYKTTTGGSTAGTEIVKAKSIPANDWIDVYFPNGDKWVPTSHFLVGHASVADVVNIQVFGDIFVS